MPEPFYFMVKGENLDVFRSPGYSVPAIEEITIPLRNPLDGPVVYVCSDDITAKRISEARTAPMRNVEPILPHERFLEKYGSMTIKHPWFSATRAALDYFNKCVEHEKKARIVIDYDPQSENTKITYYRDTAMQEVAHE